MSKTFFIDDLSEGRRINTRFIDGKLELDIESGIEYFIYGERYSRKFDISSDELLTSSIIFWESKEPIGTELIIESKLSFDGGVNWTQWTPINGINRIPGLTPGTNISNAMIQFKVKFYTDDFNLSPELYNLEFTIEINKDIFIPDSPSDFGLIQDIQYFSADNYNENVGIRWGTEIQLIKNRYALWQGVVGEIKTRKGECRGVGTESYGCDIWLAKGENIDPILLDQISMYIKDLERRYADIDTMEVKSVTKRKDGSLKLHIIVYSKFGEIGGDIIV